MANPYGPCVFFSSSRHLVSPSSAATVQHDRHFRTILFDMGHFGRKAINPCLGSTTGAAAGNWCAELTGTTITSNAPRRRAQPSCWRRALLPMLAFITMAYSKSPPSC